MAAVLPAPSGIVTLLTDFGLSDPFVGVMTGAILSRFRQATVVDLCHGIRPQALREAAFWLQRCHPWFPPGTVHVGVVDPGVGTERRILAAALAGHWFLVPDNGLLGPALLGTPGAEVVAVNLEQVGLRPESATFHGRDVFAPLAAELASGRRSLGELGAAAVPVPCVLPAPVHQQSGVVGEVVTIDRFGNLISNLDQALVTELQATHVSIAGHDVALRRTYAEVEAGSLLALVNSFGVIEVAQREGTAEGRLRVGRGERIELLAPERPTFRLIGGS
jgi:S-adenosylmethionine hydrolase